MLLTIKTILELVKEFLHWRRVVAEIEARRLLVSELEGLDNEIDKLEELVAAARHDNHPELADRLLEDYTRRCVYRAGIHSLSQGPSAPGTKRHDASN